MTSYSPATTQTVRSTPASPATASRRPTSQGPRATGRGDSGGRQDRRGRHGGRLPGPDEDFLLARYNPNGTLDTASPATASRRPTSGGPDEATGVAIQASGKIVVVGGGGIDGRGPTDFALARYNPNGSLDTSFSGDGRQITDFLGFDQGESRGDPGERQDHRGWHRRGRSTSSPPAFALARYNPNGSLDGTYFSGDGKQTTGFGEHGKRGGAPG